MPDWSSSVVRLVSDIDDLTLTAANGWGITSLNFGDPELRASITPFPDQDGEVNNTNFIGARVITLGLELAPITQTLWTMMYRLRAFTHVRRTIEFRFQADPLAPSLLAYAKRGPWSNPLDRAMISPVVQWRVPDGIFHGTLLRSATLLPGVANNVVNDGNTEAWPFFIILGPITNPIISHPNNDHEFRWTGSIAADHSLWVDPKNKTVLYDNGINVYNDLVIPPLPWWQLTPGGNSLTLTGTGTSGATYCLVTYRDAYDL